MAANLITPSSIAPSISLAESITCLGVYSVGLVLNSLLVGCVVVDSGLTRTRLGKTIALLLGCFVGTSWPEAYSCDDPIGQKCSAVPAQIIGSLFYTCFVFTLAGHLLWLWIGTCGGVEKASSEVLESPTSTLVNIDLSWTMTATLAFCYIPGIVYFGVRASGNDVIWMDFIGSLLISLDVVISPVLIMYFQRPFLESFFDLYLSKFV
ncbi:hypothetical protein BCR33DRAFT_716385 [Rhizoclosmatium globosum]|uniref:Uncharacterized protein n=1 Tax=Rhizoclosmatium globosum TaxID=329046 RepID=A0A1Y2CFA9_9FUNG|nr:hypothetical protein BCR33DRAFT_716385 [Rhizoclosmatium globosum]|eukprot:ORY45753.1 hypothetical protein BCR33DRAFT_716385 [Rhizoclosmatium globosum]